jgi:hypothetical protein
MSLLLEAVIDNTRYKLPTLVHRYAENPALQAHEPHALATLFRSLGVSRMFIEGVVEPLFLAQMQSAGAYLHGLRRLTDEQKVTSRSSAWWDAIGGEYWDAALDIARNSRPSPNLTWEHEDDFLYVYFLMTHYFLSPRSRGQGTGSEQPQSSLLARWEQVLDGGFDPRLDLCKALVAADADAFLAALLQVADAREADVRQKVARGSLTDEDAAWFLPFWGEGLALLRLAERGGLSIAEACPMVPEIARSRNGLPFDARAWTRPELLG